MKQLLKKDNDKFSWMWPPSSPKANCLCHLFQGCLWDADGHNFERTSEEESSLPRARIIKWGFTPAFCLPGFRAAGWTYYHWEDPGVCPAGESAEAVPGVDSLLSSCGLLPSHTPAEKQGGEIGPQPSPGDDPGHWWVGMKPSSVLLTFVPHQRLTLLSVLPSVHLFTLMASCPFLPTFPLLLPSSSPSPHSLPLPLHHLFDYLLWTRWWGCDIENNIMVSIIVKTLGYILEPQINCYGG